ncbi:MAG: formate dehydrogenase, beta subunit, partial [Methylococcaceae bacterium NSP1-2]
MSITLYVSGDSSAISLGANRTAAAIVKEAERRGIDIKLVRNGSRGMYWLEPLVEVEVNGERIAYGAVSANNVSSLFNADFIHGGQHPLALGVTEEIPYFKKQQRLTFARVGLT